MKYGQSSSGCIPVASESEVALWTRGRSRGAIRRIEAVEVDGRPQSVFNADQLLVDSRDGDLVNELREDKPELFRRPPVNSPRTSVIPRPL